MNLATKLVTLRKQKGLTQMDLAEQLNVSRQAISRWEVGSAVPSTDNLKELSVLYEVTLDYLMNDDIDVILRATSEEHFDVAEEKKRRGNKFYVIVAVILCAIVMTISILVLRDVEERPITPIEDMTNVEDDDRSTVTFSIE